MLDSRAVRNANESPVDASLIADLCQIIGENGMVLRATELKVYECDGWTMEKSSPEILLRPRTTAEVSAILKLLHRRGIAFVPRGAGTGLSGGCLPLDAPVMICTSRMNRILQIDYASRRIEVESGVVNLHVTNAVKARAGWSMRPIRRRRSHAPSAAISRKTPAVRTPSNTASPLIMCSASNWFCPMARSSNSAAPPRNCCGYDLVGAIVGSEGTTGIVTRATLKLTREPEEHRTLLAIFADVDNATRAVSAIIAAGIIPGAIEMMDQMIIRAVEAAFHAGLPEDAGAVLIIELDGIAAGLDDHAASSPNWCAAPAPTTFASRATKLSARSCGRRANARSAQSAGWRPITPRRTASFRARGCPTFCARFIEISRRHNLRIGNVFHAGDGNIHPIVLYDERDADETSRAVEAGRDILKACVEMGGSLTGEHGIGVEKMAEMPLIFSPEDLIVMSELRRVFDPDQRANPNKIIPVPGVLRRSRGAAPAGRALMLRSR